MLAAAGSGAMGVFAKVAYDAGFEARSLLLLRFLAAAAVMWGIVALRRPARASPCSSSWERKWRGDDGNGLPDP